MEERSWRSDRGGEIDEIGSKSTDRGGEIVEEVSRRIDRGGKIVKKRSRNRDQAGEGIKEEILWGRDRGGEIEDEESHIDGRMWTKLSLEPEQGVSSSGSITKLSLFTLNLYIVLKIFACF